MTQEELEFRRRCPYDAFGDYSDVLKEIRQKEKENKTDTVSVVNGSKECWVNFSTVIVQQIFPYRRQQVGASVPLIKKLAESGSI